MWSSPCLLRQPGQSTHQLMALVMGVIVSQFWRRKLLNRDAGGPVVLWRSSGEEKGQSLPSPDVGGLLTAWYSL